MHVTTNGCLLYWSIFWSGQVLLRLWSIMSKFNGLQMDVGLLGNYLLIELPCAFQLLPFPWTSMFITVTCMHTTQISHVCILLKKSLSICKFCACIKISFRICYSHIWMTTCMYLHAYQSYFICRAPCVRNMFFIF